MPSSAAAALDRGRTGAACPGLASAFSPSSVTSTTPSPAVTCAATIVASIAPEFTAAELVKTCPRQEQNNTVELAMSKKRHQPGRRAESFVVVESYLATIMEFDIATVSSPKHLSQAVG